jgi:hypothetical protein
MDDLAAKMYASLADGSLAQYMRSLLRNVSVKNNTPMAGAGDMRKYT